MIRCRRLLSSLVCVAAVATPLCWAWAQDDSSDQLVPMIVELLTDNDKDLRALGLEQVRTQAKGEAATKQFLALLPSQSVEAQVSLIDALAVRGDRIARPALLDLLAGSTGEEVRRAAIEALGSLGEPADVTLLTELLAHNAPAQQRAARASLTRLAGESVPQMIVARMKSAGTPLRVALIEILAARRALETVEELLSAAVDADPSVRGAAMTALGKLAGPEHIPGMIQGVLHAEEGPQRAAAEKAVMFVCNRIEDERQRTETLLQALDQLSEQDHLAILPTLGRVGGNASLQIVEAAIQDPRPRVHDQGLRALCSWPDASVADRLTELVKADQHSEHQTMALRALIRVAPLPDGRSDAEKLELLQQAMALCHDEAEGNFALRRAGAIRIVETLRFLLPYLERPAYAQQACHSVVELAHHRNLRQPHEAEFDQALDRVIQISKDATVVDRAQRYQKDQTWVRPKTPARTR